MVVLKFGGTSVADAGPVSRAAEIVARQTGPRIAAVSALAGVTDRLVQIAALAEAGRLPAARGVLQRLTARHHELAAAFPGPVPQPLTHQINRFHAEMDTLVCRAAADRHVPASARDLLLGYGELLSSAVIAWAFERLGVPAAWVDARQVIVTDGNHGAATPLLEETAARVRDHLSPVLADGRVPVIGGFVGATPDGVGTTLGRGGSDVSAAILGVCARAREIQIWTDVDGVLAADPRVVRNPARLPHLSFAEAGALASFGAKVLHPATIDVAGPHGVPVRVLNSRRPDVAGTLIDAEAHDARPGPVAFAARRGTVAITATPRTGSVEALVQDVLGIVGSRRPQPYVAHASDGRAIVVLEDSMAAADLAASLQDVAEVRIERDVALLAAVGDEVFARPGAAAEVLETLDGLGVQAIAQPAAGRLLALVLEDADAAEAMTRLHERYYPAPAPSGLDPEAPAAGAPS